MTNKKLFFFQKIMYSTGIHHLRNFFKEFIWCGRVVNGVFSYHVAKFSSRKAEMNPPEAERWEHGRNGRGVGGLMKG